MTSSNGAEALPAMAAAFGLPEPPRAATPEALYAAERGLLEGFRVVPLFHVPDLYAVSPRVKGGPGLTPLGEWRFENAVVGPAMTFRTRLLLDLHAWRSWRRSGSSSCWS